jgi:hypothetical protein
VDVLNQEIEQLNTVDVVATGSLAKEQKVFFLRKFLGRLDGDLPIHGCLHLSLLL